MTSATKNPHQVHKERRVNKRYRNQSHKIVSPFGPKNPAEAYKPKWRAKAPDGTLTEASLTNDSPTPSRNYGLTASRYHGVVCKKHPESEGLRYIRTFRCVHCTADVSARRRRGKKLLRKQWYEEWLKEPVPAVSPALHESLVGKPYNPKDYYRGAPLWHFREWLEKNQDS